MGAKRCEQEELRTDVADGVFERHIRIAERERREFIFSRRSDSRVVDGVEASAWRLKHEGHIFGVHARRRYAGEHDMVEDHVSQRNGAVKYGQREAGELSAKRCEQEELRTDVADGVFERRTRLTERQGRDLVFSRRRDPGIGNLQGNRRCPRLLWSKKSNERERAETHGFHKAVRQSPAKFTSLETGCRAEQATAGEPGVPIARHLIPGNECSVCPSAQSISQ